MKNKKLKIGLGVAVVALVAACGTLDPAKVAKIDPTGKGEFLGKAYADGASEREKWCNLYPNKFCGDPAYELIGVVIATSYSQGYAKTPVFVPRSAHVHAAVSDGDIVKIRIDGRTAYWLETVAKHGDKTCYWDGTLGLTGGGVECPRLGYSYKSLNPYDETDFWK